MLFVFFFFVRIKCECIAIPCSIHLNDVKVLEFVSRNRWRFHRAREERKSASEKWDAPLSSLGLGVGLGRTRKGRGGLLPARRRQSGFPLGNARAKWRRSLGRNARACCETIEPCRWFDDGGGYIGCRSFRDYSFHSSMESADSR